MKKLLGIVVLGLLLSGNAYALNFKQNLYEYKETNKGTTSAIYVLNRCTGILTYNSIMMFKENTEVGLRYNFMSSDLVNLASKMYSEYNGVTLETATDINLNRMMQLDKFYRQDANEMFLKNGSYLTGIVGEDLIFCETLHGRLKKINEKKEKERNDLYERNEIHQKNLDENKKKCFELWKNTFRKDFEFKNELLTIAKHVEENTDLDMFLEYSKDNDLTLGYTLFIIGNMNVHLSVKNENTFNVNTYSNQDGMNDGKNFNIDDIEKCKNFFKEEVLKIYKQENT